MNQEWRMELDKSTVKLQTYTGSIMIKVTSDGQTKSLLLIIIKGNGPILLGQNWLEALRLDWRKIF